MVINKFMPGVEGAILNAVLLGKRDGIEEDINEDFVKTGTVHILAISGLHVWLLVSIFGLLFKLLRVPFKIQTLILTFFLIVYCITVDNRPPVIRSTIMILVFLFGRVLRREQDLLNSLTFSALIILFFNPQELFDVGFQLSFLTVGSIIYYSPRLETLLLKRDIIEKERARVYFLRAALVSFCAWLGSAPFIAKYFNIFSPITVLANLFVVPLMFFVLALSLTFILFSFFSHTAGLIFSEVSKLSISILLKIVSIFSKVPFSYFRVKSPPWLLIVAFYMFVLLFLNRHRIRIKGKYFIIIALLSINIFVWCDVFFILKRHEFLKISFLDVGKGDAIFLEFPKGGTMLIDGGEGLGSDMGRLVVGRFLSFKGINRV
ncbi:MAG: ComEC/Rec2 family competence protein, partial [Candidatus Omnitrophica bacterium]|nr:ComEC/Rec2 family competence protein [Candidatus Omnitrophota bacterium]